MPIQHCQVNKNPGYKWGRNGKCYVYSKGDKVSEAEALARAQKQGVAVRMEQNK